MFEQGDEEGVEDEGGYEERKVGGDGAQEQGGYDDEGYVHEHGGDVIGRH